MSISLADHLRDEHRISPLQTYLKEIVYGGNDGIVTTFAVVAGFTGANIAHQFPEYSFFTVLLFGTANLFADATSMGLGNFLSLRAEKDVYRAAEQKERFEIRNNPEMERKETKEILMEQGFSIEQAQELTNIYAKNEKYWVSFMMNYELQMANPQSVNPIFTALATFLAFIGFGAIPLIPYLLTLPPNTAFIAACFAAACALLLLGVLRWKVTGVNLFRSVAEIVLVGGTAAVIAYTVGTFFKP